MSLTDDFIKNLKDFDGKEHTVRAFNEKGDLIELPFSKVKIVLSKDPRTTPKDKK